MGWAPLVHYMRQMAVARAGDIKILAEPARRCAWLCLWLDEKTISSEDVVYGGEVTADEGRRVMEGAEWWDLDGSTNLERMMGVL